ncbi:MAG: putative hemolysin [Halobacteriales archaeon]|jgi:putative hemolysin
MGTRGKWRECMQAGHARLPVYEGSLDDVVGIFDIRDLDRDADYDESATLAVEGVVKPTLHVPESKHVDELLSEMRENRIHMVIVVDEFGATEGLITMEDIVEEIVGEILMGGEDIPIEFVDETEVLVRGEVSIEEINEALNIHLPEGEEFETIAGFISTEQVVSSDRARSSTMRTSRCGPNRWKIPAFRRPG